MSGQVLGWPLYALKNFLSRVWIWTSSNTRFLGLTQVDVPNGILIGSAGFAGLGLTVVTDRQTDRWNNRPRHSVSNNTAHLARAAMRHNKKIKINKKSSYHRRTARRDALVEIVSTVVQLYKTAFEEACHRHRVNVLDDWFVS